MTSFRTGLFYLLFFVAGAPALVYQTVWQRVLTLYFGVDIYSTSITVASVMLGLGVGSLIGGRLADRSPRPVLLYVVVELLIGLFGAASLPLFAAVGAALAGSSLAIVIPVDFLLLLAPTLLMGMTLPLMCRIVTTADDQIGAHLAWLYGLNTLGAALGALVSSYLLCGLYGLDGTTRIAAGINFALAIGAFLLSRSGAAVEAPSARRAAVAPAADVAAQAAGPEIGFAGILALSFLSGWIALGFEILWYRVLSLLLHGTVYVFGTILFFYLLGIGVGSLFARRTIETGSPLLRFARCQLGIGAYAVLLFAALMHLSWLPGLRHVIGASTFTTFHPSPELIVGKVSLVTLYSLLDIVFWTGLVLGLPTFLMGYGFPNLLRAGSQTVHELGRSVAAIYFANIVGSTLGTLVVGFVLLHWCGMEITLATLVIVGTLPALWVFVRGARASEATTRHSVARWTWGSAGVIAAAALLLPWPRALVEALHYGDHDGVTIVGAEDRGGVVALRRQDQRISFAEEDQVLGKYRLYIDGLAHGGFDSLDVLYPELAGDLAIAAHPRHRRALCIGLGDGKTATSILRGPTVEELVIVELSTSLVDVLGRTPQGRFVLDAPQTRLLLDDGRRWLQAHPEERFDIIACWALHAACSHSGNLYSQECFELMAKHLNPGGILVTRTADLYSTPKTLATVFPYVVRAERGCFLASNEPITFDLSRLSMTREEFVELIEADRELILENTADARVNRDFRPNTEYYITYPYTWSLQTRGRDQNDHGFRLNGGPRVEGLIRAPAPQCGQTKLAPAYPRFFLPLVGGRFQHPGSPIVHAVPQLELRPTEQFAIAFGGHQPRHHLKILVKGTPQPLVNPLRFSLLGLIQFHVDRAANHRCSLQPGRKNR